MNREMPLCGDPTCENYSCTQEALDAWHDRQQAEARKFVRSMLGLPDEHPDEHPTGGGV